MIVERAHPTFVGGGVGGRRSGAVNLLGLPLIIGVVEDVLGRERG